MRRLAEYKQIGIKIEPKIIHHEDEYDDHGEITTKAYDEEIAVEVPVMGMVYRDMTPEEEAEEINKIAFIPIDQQIAKLKQQLFSSDYKAIKYTEGWISEEEYAPIKAERQAIRDQINELENNYLSVGGEVTE